MAIVKMKRVTVVGPADRKADAVDTLQDLGAMHVVPLVEEIQEPTELTSRLLAVRRVQNALKKKAGQLDQTPKAPELDDHEVVEKAETALGRIGELEGRLAVLGKDRDQAAAWGRLSKDGIEELEKRGLYVTLYAVRTDQKNDLDLSKAAWHAFFPYPAKSRHEALAIISLDEPFELDLDPIQPLARPLEQLDEEFQTAREELDAANKGLSALTGGLEAVEREQKRVTDKLALARATSSTGGDDEVFAMVGWCPADKTNELTDRLTPAVAVLTADPDAKESVPIAIRNGPIVEFFEPLLKLFNLPHYREGDPTLFIAPFMGVFFGFCLGDAAYGILLMILATVLKKKFKLEGDGLKAILMLQICGGMTVLIGLLTGMFFGIQLWELGFIKAMGFGPEDLLFFMSSSPDKFFYASLMFGVVQLELGILIRLVRKIRLREVQAAICQIGWFTVVPGILAVIFLETHWALPMASAGLIYLFSYPDMGVKRLGAGIWALYNVIGLFGDIMSYARIFGLGLSSGIIAMVINQIAMSASGAMPPLGWIGAALILVLGHGFNFAMATIGAVVHPARLQFLEFFDKFFEGGGKAYEPLRKLQKE